MGELRWLIGASCDLPAMLNTGLLEWSKTSWYLSECESTDPASGLPRYWRMGPKPNLNQMHDTYKRNALKNARTKFDALVKDCRPLRDGCMEEGVDFHLLPSGRSGWGMIRHSDWCCWERTTRVRRAACPRPMRWNSCGRIPRPPIYGQNQNVLLVVIPSEAGLLQAEQEIASWMAWGEIKNSNAFKDLEPEQQETVKRREPAARRDALTAVKNAFELVIYVDSAGNAQQKKLTMGNEALFPTLVREKDLRIFRQNQPKNATAQGAPSANGRPSDPSIKVKTCMAHLDAIPICRSSSTDG